MQSQPSADTQAPIIACPHCHSLVRVPAERLTQTPKCGKCKAPVLEGRVATLDAAAFTQHVGKATFPVLVDFWAPWCGPCKMMAPILDRVAAEWSTRLQVGKVNTDEQAELSNRYQIRSIPTLILFKDGAEVARQSGAVAASTLQRWLESAGVR